MLVENSVSTMSAVGFEAPMTATELMAPMSAQPFGQEAPMSAASTEEYVKKAFTRKEVIEATKTVGKYVKANSLHYGQMAKEQGLKATADQIKEDMVLDGYGAILDAVGDNLLALVPIIIIIALVPYISWQVIKSFNISDLPSEWTGGLDASTVWITASLLIGAIITISLVTLIIVQLKKFRNNAD